MIPNFILVIFRIGFYFLFFIKQFSINFSTTTTIKSSKSKFKTRELVDVSAADGAGPTPQSYHVPRRPPNERIAPMFTFGARNLNEKSSFIFALSLSLSLTFFQSLTLHPYHTHSHNTHKKNSRNE